MNMKKQGNFREQIKTGIWCQSIETQNKELIKKGEGLKDHRAKNCTAKDELLGQTWKIRSDNSAFSGTTCWWMDRKHQHCPLTHAVGAPELVIDWEWVEKAWFWSGFIIFLWGRRRVARIQMKLQVKQTARLSVSTQKPFAAPLQLIQSLQFDNCLHY